VSQALCKLIENLERRRAVALLKASAAASAVGAGHSRAINIEGNVVGGTTSPFHSESNGIGHSPVAVGPRSGTNTPANRQVPQVGKFHLEPTSPLEITSSPNFPILIGDHSQLTTNTARPKAT